MGKKIDIEYNEKLDYKNLDKVVKIASIKKSNKELLPVIYRADFQQAISNATRVKNAVGEFAFFGIKEGTNKGEILVDNNFINLYNNGKKEICLGILAHEYGHYVDDKNGTRHDKGFDAALKADITADMYGVEATSRMTILNTLIYMKDYYEKLKDDKYKASIYMLNERIDKSSKHNQKLNED